MAWQDIAAKVAQGFAGAAGNEDAAAQIGQYQQQRQQGKEQQQQSATAPYSMAIKGLQDKLSTIDQAKDPTAYNSTVDQIQQNIHAIRDIFHPDAKLDAGDWLKTHTTDRMHITNHDQRLKDVLAQNAASTAQDKSQAGAYAQGAPTTVNPYTQERQQLTGAGFSEPDIQTALRNKAGLTPKDTTETERFVTNYKTQHPGATDEQALRAYTDATDKTVAKPAAPLEAGGVVYGVRGTDGQEYRPDANGKFPDGTPPEVPQIYHSVISAQNAKQAETDKKQQEIESRFERSLSAREQDKGTWTVTEGDNGETKLLNSKTGEMKDAPSGLHKSGYYAKQVAPLEAANMNISSYIDGKVYDGPGDLALQHEFFTATQPATGFRMTKVQQDILQGSQSWLNSMQAKAHHLATGTWFSDTQRQQIAKTAQEAIEAKKKSLSGGGPKTDSLQGTRNQQKNNPSVDKFLKSF